jgi:hypothetical protein
VIRVLCWLLGHDWLRTLCGFGLNDYIRDCRRCRRREWLSGGEWVEERPACWAPQTHPYQHGRDEET